MSVELGRYNTLRVVKEVDFGLYLDGGEEGEILLPRRYVPAGCEPGDMLRVFIYLDNEERLVATTQEPLAQVGEFACLRVAWVNQYGAFLDWGLLKDLFVPFAQQRERMEVGRKYVVYVHVDEESYRIVATAKVERYLSTRPAPYRPGEEVDVMLWRRTDLGYVAIIDNRYEGLVYANEIFRPVEPGLRLLAYVKQVRPDGKIDLSLQRPGGRPEHDFAAVLLEHLRRHGGHIDQHDGSPAGEIYRVFGVSKKVFKRAVGELYRKRLVTLAPDGIDLVARK